MPLLYNNFWVSRNLSSLFQRKLIRVCYISFVLLYAKFFVLHDVVTILLYSNFLGVQEPTL
jgi:hypothetical protein